MASTLSSALEIALTRAPVTERRRFLAWLFTVLRHEAIAVSRARTRESPGSGEDVGEMLADEPGADDGPQAAMEWRMRYRALQDALASLSEAQRVCLMLQSAGASYEAIAQITASNPQGRLIQPGEVASAVVWLALPEQAAVTGQAIPIAGGEVM